MDRLRFILSLQRDSYLPLKVIRERLAAYDAGLVTGGNGGDAGRSGSRDRGDTPAVQSAAAGPPSGGRAPRRTSPSRRPRSTFPRATSPPRPGSTSARSQSLQSFGVICRHTMNGGTYYDQDDLIVGRIARDFLQFGVEARHLKMFRQFAEREAALFEQVVLPAFRNRSPETRKQATQSLSELTRLSKKLRHAFLRQNLRAYLAGDR